MTAEGIDFFPPNVSVRVIDQQQKDTVVAIKFEKMTCPVSPRH
ncbi:hypothetical protein SAMN05216344_12842 [Polaromonas sp. OV174]|nr:hypothetical protein SAMN05216344_12842 [Polaromonas sp. OV174]